MTHPVQQKINLSLASVLVIDNSQHVLDILTQVMKGMGAQDIHRCTTVAEASQFLAQTPADLIVIDPTLKDEDGYEFIRSVRRSSSSTQRVAPIISMSGYSTAATVARARDCGANFFVAKPITPKVLIDRLIFIGRDNRQFIEVEGGYCGPDRRFKFEGPPPGSLGRRAEDKAPVGDASAPNMSQDEVDFMIKPQRVQL